jgi:hypothetical protein
MSGGGETRDAHTVLVGKPEGKNHLEEVGLAGSVILKWNFK